MHNYTLAWRLANRAFRFLLNLKLLCSAFPLSQAGRNLTQPEVFERLAFVPGPASHIGELSWPRHAAAPPGVACVPADFEAELWRRPRDEVDTVRFLARESDFGDDSTENWIPKAGLRILPLLTHVLAKPEARLSCRAAPGL